MVSQSISPQGGNGRDSTTVLSDSVPPKLYKAFCLHMLAVLEASLQSFPSSAFEYINLSQGLFHDLQPQLLFSPRLAGFHRRSSPYHRCTPDILIHKRQFFLKKKNNTILIYITITFYN